MDADLGIKISLNHRFVKLINKPTKNTGSNSLMILIPFDRKARISKSLANLPNTVMVANKVDIGMAIAITNGSLRIIIKRTVLNGILYFTASPIKLNKTVLPSRMIVKAKIPLNKGIRSSLIMYLSISFIN